MARIRGLHPASNPSKSTSSGGDPPYRKKGAAAVGLPTACEKTHSKNLWTFFSTILLVLIAFPAVDLAAQDCIDFEIDPVTGTEWVEIDQQNSPGEFENEVSNQYEISHGITFQVTSGPNMPATGNAYPRICKVGAPGEAFIYGLPISNHPNYCESDNPGGSDNPNYSTIPNNPNSSAPPPSAGVPPYGVGGFGVPAGLDVNCFFLGDHTPVGVPNTGGTPPDQFNLRVTYSDWRECYQLSGTLLDIDAHGGIDEAWTVTAYGTESGNTGTQLGNAITTGTPGDGTLVRFELDVSAAVPPIKIDYVDITYTGTVNNVGVGLGFDNFCPCSLMPTECIEVVEETIECIPVDEGGFDYLAQLTNISDFQVVKMFIPDVVDPVTGDTLVDIEPNVIQGFPPVESGDPLPPLDLTFNGAASGDDFTYTVALMAKNEEGVLFECCSHEMEVSLPICCNDLAEDSVDVHCQDADGNFPFDFSFLNWGHMAPSEAAHAFLLPISPAGVTFEPDYFDLTQMGSQPTVSDGSYSSLLSTMIQGAGLGQEITFELIIHNEDMSECCNQVHTIITSDCTAGGGGGSNASSEASFLRGDANTDGSFDIADVIRSLGYLFQDLPVSCLLALDSNDDQTVDVGDSIYSLNALFGGGPSPGPPHQQCGDDTSAGTLDCDSFPLCDTANNDPQGG